MDSYLSGGAIWLSMHWRPARLLVLRIVIAVAKAYSGGISQRRGTTLIRCRMPASRKDRRHTACQACPGQMQLDQRSNFSRGQNSSVSRLLKESGAFADEA